MLHMVFYARIAEEKGAFDIADSIHAECEKLIQRHPHIYGDVEVKDEEDVKRNWEKIKLKEGKTSVLSGVPKGLPSMVKAMRLQEKAKQVGFECDNREQVWDKVEEEIKELAEAVEARDHLDNEEKNIKVEEELGDVFFSLVNYARFLRSDAEQALERTNKKFISRFREMEAVALQQGKDLQHMTLAEMDELWNTIKRPKV